MVNTVVLGMMVGFAAPIVAVTAFFFALAAALVTRWMQKPFPLIGAGGRNR